jgi:hypothetical protein
VYLCNKNMKGVGLIAETENIYGIKNKERGTLKEK